MKKIIIMLCLVAFVVAMAVPAFAASATFEGKYKLADYFDPNTCESYSFALPFKAEFNGVVYSYDGVNIEVGDLSTGEKYLLIRYISVGSAGRNDLVYTSWTVDTGIGWRTNSDIIEVESVVLYDAPHYLMTQFATPICDGSTCPATNVGPDDICDDCGRVLLMSLRPITLESLKASTPYYHYLQYKTVDSNTGEYIATRLSFLSSNSPMTVTKAEFDRLNDSAWGGVNFRFTGESDIDGVNYISHDGGQTWEQETTFSNGTSLFGVDENIIASTFNLYDSETGDLFFPLPLWVEMEQVTQGELPNLMQTTGGTITTLVLCGVGLMALLVVLALFGKRSLIYRS